MTKTDIVKELTKEKIEGVTLTQDSAKEVLDAILNVIVKGIKEDGFARVTGFGTFKCNHVEAYEGHNPRNPEEKIMIPARNQVTFTCGKQLKEAVNAPSKAVKKVVKKK